MLQTLNTLARLDELQKQYGTAYLLKPKVYLPPPKHDHIKVTLIIDLDETLIHCLDEREIEMGLQRPEVVVQVPYLEDDGRFECFVEAEVIMRPYLNECLERLSSNFQLVLFTAAESAYADAILEKIDPENKFFDARLYR